VSKCIAKSELEKDSIILGKLGSVNGVEKGTGKGSSIMKLSCECMKCKNELEKAPIFWRFCSD
jgi:hypothetical protein